MRSVHSNRAAVYSGHLPQVSSSREFVPAGRPHGFPPNFPQASHVAPTTTQLRPVSQPTVRLAASEQDRAQVIDFFQRLDDDTWVKRFWGPKINDSQSIGRMVDGLLRHPHLMCFSGDQLIGVALVGRTGPQECELALVVSPEFQGARAGAALVGASLQMATQSGVKKVVAYTSAASSPRIEPLLARFGFARVGREGSAAIWAWSSTVQPDRSAQARL